MSLGQGAKAKRQDKNLQLPALQKRRSMLTGHRPNESLTVRLGVRITPTSSAGSFVQ